MPTALIVITLFSSEFYVVLNNIDVHKDVTMLVYMITNVSST